VTGRFFVSGLSDKRLQLLKQAFPAIQKVAVLANPPSPKYLAAARSGIRLLSLAVSTRAELYARAPAALSASDGLLVVPDALFWTTGRRSSISHPRLTCPPLIRSGNMPTIEG
jgi:hypothetical protein